MASNESDYDRRFNPVYQQGHEDDGSARPESPPVVERSREFPAARNPWLVVLWLLAVGLLASGLGALWYSQTLLAVPNPDSVQEFYVIPAVLAALAPWFVLVGLAALVGVVFLHAVRWGRG